MTRFWPSGIASSHRFAALGHLNHTSAGTRPSIFSTGIPARTFAHSSAVLLPAGGGVLVSQKYMPSSCMSCDALPQCMSPLVEKKIVQGSRSDSQYRLAVLVNDVSSRSASVAKFARVQKPLRKVLSWVWKSSIGIKISAANFVGF